MSSVNYFRRNRGSTLIEALVAILILSFGLLALGGFLTYAVQLPKLSGNRSVAVVAANDLVERMRANSSGSLSYVTSTFSATSTVPSSMPSGSTCSFPNCTATSLATYGRSPRWTSRLNGSCQRRHHRYHSEQRRPHHRQRLGHLAGARESGHFQYGGSDNCPSAVASLGLSPAPRLRLRPFRL
jgi:type IV pilus modification protein PilV